MEWLRDFQESLREPVYGFIGSYWLVLAAILLLAIGWFVGSVTPRRGGNAELSIGRNETESDGGGDGGGD